MASEGKTPGLKQLRVDNWAQFFVQRLQLLFAKGDSCDLTLKFFTGQQLKVHSLVLRTCTSHFEALPKTDNVIDLPETLSYCTVFPIINFMYSGKLEFKPELQSQLLTVVKILNITILLKLLLAQRDGAPGSTVKAKAIPNDGTKPSQIIVQQSTPSSSGILSGKKLPFWRKRTYPLIKYTDRKPVEDEPGPTRFHWPDTDSMELVSLTSPSFSSLSFEDDPIVKPPPKIEIDRSTYPTRRIIESRMLATHDSDDDDDRFETVYSSDEESTPPPPPPPPAQPPPVLKPCLKTPSTDTPSPAQAKRVRFSLTPDGKENSVINSTQSSSSNHAKIIQEVLKKYPDLVKNKNIKLKISSPKPKVENGDTNDDKASYVVLRPSGSLRTGLLTSTPNTSKTQCKFEPQSGPWSCEHCPEIKFELYQDFRKHIFEAHGEKLDARICEYCGHKASKRNLHLFHLFTKHNVPPPKNINFPKCPECSYIALSESLLSKHLNSHIQGKESNKDSLKEFKCDRCNIVMKNEASFYAHKVTCKPGNEPRNIICDLCKTAFRTNVSLNAHLKECQGKPEAPTIYNDEAPQTVGVIEVPIIETVDVDKANHTLVQLPPGLILADNQNMALLPTTSTADSLNGVSSNIATSIALALPPNHHQQAAVILLQGNGPEYIVPEFLDSSFTSGNLTYTGQNQVIYLGGPSGNGTSQEVIHIEEISQSTPSTSPVQVENSGENSALSLPIITSEQDVKPQCSQDIIINVEGSSVPSEAAVTNQSEIIYVDDSVKEEEVDSSVVVEDTNNTKNNSNSQPPESEEVLIACENLIQSEETYSNDSINSKELNRIKTYSDINRSNGGEVKEKIYCPTKNVKQEENVHCQESITLPSNAKTNTVCETGPLQAKSITIHCSSDQILSEIKSVNVQEMSVHSSGDVQKVQISSEPVQDVEIIERIDLLAENVTNTKEHKQVSEASKNIGSEEMQVDEVREDMIVDVKDEESMDIEEIVEPKENKDAMDVEESSKTGDERVNNLVKDWGFDEEEVEEAMDETNSKKE